MRDSHECHRLIQALTEKCTDRGGMWITAGASGLRRAGARLHRIRERGTQRCPDIAERWIVAPQRVAILQRRFRCLRRLRESIVCHRSKAAARAVHPIVGVVGSSFCQRASAGPVPHAGVAAATAPEKHDFGSPHRRLDLPPYRPLPRTALGRYPVPTAVGLTLRRSPQTSS